MNESPTARRQPASLHDRERATALELLPLTAQEQKLNAMQQLKECGYSRSQSLHHLWEDHEADRNRLFVCRQAGDSIQALMFVQTESVDSGIHHPEPCRMEVDVFSWQTGGRQIRAEDLWTAVDCLAAREQLFVTRANMVIHQIQADTGRKQPEEQSRS